MPADFTSVTVEEIADKIVADFMNMPIEDLRLLNDTIAGCIKTREEEVEIERWKNMVKAIKEWALVAKNASVSIDGNTISLSTPEYDLTILR